MGQSAQRIDFPPEQIESRYLIERYILVSDIEDQIFTKQYILHIKITDVKKDIEKYFTISIEHSGGALAISHFLHTKLLKKVSKKEKEIFDDDFKKILGVLRRAKASGTI